MSIESNISSEGLIASVRSIAVTLLSIVYTRLELLSTDVEEGWVRLMSMLVMAFIALFCFCFGVVLLSILVVVTFWDTHRLLVLGMLTGIFLVTGIILSMIAIHKLKSMPKLFEASMVELTKDQEQLNDNQ